MLFRPGYKASKISGNLGRESQSSLPIDPLAVSSARSKDSAIDSDKHKLMWQLMSEYINHEPEHVLKQIQRHV